VTEGEAVASSTRDVGAESAAHADRGGGYAKTAELTGRAREQRERGKRARARRRRPALTGGPARAERERGDEARARDWAGWAERPRGGGVVGFFSFFFYSGICFLFSFYLLYLIQIQMSHKFKLAFLRIMHQTKVGFRV
jgi:hypothetical protein